MFIGMVLDLMKSPKHGSLCLQMLRDREVSPYVLPNANLLSEMWNKRQCIWNLKKRKICGNKDDGHQNSLMHVTLTITLTMVSGMIFFIWPEQTQDDWAFQRAFRNVFVLKNLYKSNNDQNTYVGDIRCIWGSFHR